jgi:LuxR family transcriptional regulator, maltose regulon positive regulatory protein
VEKLLLTTRLNIPPARPNLLTRPRLIECLLTAPGYSLVLVSAPAGFGKTTLLSEWVRHNQAQTPAAWLSLEEADNDPVRFWEYFVAGLKTLHPAAGDRALAMLHYPQPSPIEPVLTTLINDLTTVPENFIFVLDDYHCIKSQPVNSGPSQK